MADAMDRADIDNEVYFKAALANRRPELPFTGRCHNCDEPVEEPNKFCDRYCREDLEKRDRFKSIH